MIKFLELCGFEADEIKSELPRVEKTFRKLGITTEDLENGKQRLTKYYDIELKGIRKILRLVIKELVDLTLAREDGKTKIFYAFMAAGSNILSTALLSTSKEIYTAYLCQQFQLVVGSIFDKMNPILEAAENSWLKNGAVAHCGNVKALVGLFSLGLIPKPDLLVTTGYLCETAPKAIELIQELYDVPTFCYDTCRDRKVAEYPAETKRIVKLAAQSMRRFSETMQKIVDIKISDDTLLEAINARGGLSSAVRKMQNIIESSDPLPITANHQLLWTCLDSLPLSIDTLPDAIEAIDILSEELQDRVSKGMGVAPKGAPRILALLPTHYTDPRLEHLIAQLGMAVVSTDTFFVFEPSKLKDPYEIICLANQQRALNHPLQGRLSLIIDGCKNLHIDGVIDRYHVGCRTVAGDAFIIKNEIMKELGLPVVLLERDDFDSRTYNPEQYQRSLETFREILAERAA